MGNSFDVDGFTGMRFSLQTREVIADSIESVTCAQVWKFYFHLRTFGTDKFQHHDANISIPGCDKNSRFTSFVQ